MPQTEQPLWHKMYFNPAYTDLVRMIGYAGLSTDAAAKKIRELPHDKEKLVKACEELLDIGAKEVQLKPHVRKLAFQLLGYPPEYVPTDMMADILKTVELPKAEKPKRTRSKKEQVDEKP